MNVLFCVYFRWSSPLQLIINIVADYFPFHRLICYLTNFLISAPNQMSNIRDQSKKDDLKVSCVEMRNTEFIWMDTVTGWLFSTRVQTLFYSLIQNCQDIFKQRALGLWDLRIGLFSYIPHCPKEMCLNTFQSIVTGQWWQCGVISLTLGDLGFDLTVVTPLGVSAMCPLLISLSCS